MFPNVKNLSNIYFYKFYNIKIPIYMYVCMYVCVYLYVHKCMETYILVINFCPPNSDHDSITV